MKNVMKHICEEMAEMLTMSTSLTEDVKKEVIKKFLDSEGVKEEDILNMTIGEYFDFNNFEKNKYELLVELIPEIEKIEDEFIKEITLKTLLDVNVKFLLKPSSSSGKYHPEYERGEFGLLIHTRIATCVAEWLCESFSIENASKDIILSSLILHDTCKYGLKFEFEHTIHEHPILVGSLITNVVEKNYSDDFSANYIASKLNQYISSHSGKWTTSKYSDIVLPEPSNFGTKLVHLADYISSRQTFIYEPAKDFLDYYTKTNEVTSYLSICL